MKPSEKLAARIKEALKNYGNYSPKIIKEEVVKTGTTTVAVRCKNHVVIAADKRMSLGSLTREHQFKKLDIVTPFSVMAYSGSVGIIQIVSHIFKNHLEDYERESERMLPLTSQAEVLRAISWDFVLAFGYVEAHFLLAGFDFAAMQPKIYELGEGGELSLKTSYAVYGSGMEPALGYIHDKFRPNLKLQDASKIVRRAIEISSHFDQHTGPDIDMLCIGSKGIFLPKTFKGRGGRELNSGS